MYPQINLSTESLHRTHSKKSLLDASALINSSHCHKSLNVQQSLLSSISLPQIQNTRSTYMSILITYSHFESLPQSLSIHLLEILQVALTININELMDSYESLPTILVWPSLEISQSLTTLNRVFSQLTNTKLTIYHISQVSPQTHPRIAWTHHPSHHSAPN